MIELDFTKNNGFIPVITQEHDTGEVLMLAYTNEEAWKKTLTTGIAHYWSRSRNKLWKKGESSGNIQKIKEIRIDCDNDCILLKVHQVGEAACHTGYKSCFFRLVKNGELVIDGRKVFDPVEKYGEKDG